MDALKCGLVPEPSGPTYTVVSSIDLSARKRMDTQSVLGGTGAVFMSTDNLFLAAPKYNASAKELAKAGAKDLKAGTLTQLARIGIADGRLSLSAQGVVAGTVLNQTHAAMQVMAVTMAVYLAISLVVSFALNLFDARNALKER